MTNITATGYIIQDVQGYAIYGVGASVDEAWADVVDAVGQFFDAYGNTIPEDDAYLTQFRTYGATAALMEHVRAYGGATTWDIVDGVACTPEEAATA
jgi:hypothetical protein